MLPPFAHVSQTALAALAAAALTSLSLLVLPGAGGQERPVPLLPALGQAVGAVTAGLEAPATVSHRAVRLTARPLRVVAKPAVPAGPRAVVHRVHRLDRTRHVARSNPRTPVAAPPSAAPTFARIRVHPPGKARALGHAKRAAGVSGVAAHRRGHGKALGHRHGPPPGHTKSAPARRLPPQSHGNGKGNGVGHGGSKR